MVNKAIHFRRELFAVTYYVYLYIEKIYRKIVVETTVVCLENAFNQMCVSQTYEGEIVR